MTLEHNVSSLQKVKILLAGTSWWSDTMYMPAIKKHPYAQVVGVLGRNVQRTKDFAQKWNIPKFTTQVDDFFKTHAHALIVATPNQSHFLLTTLGLEHKLHVLCEKPLALNEEEAWQMVALSEKNSRITMVPFTYRYMPVNRCVKKLLDENYIGQPFHLNMRYYASYGKDDAYNWRFDLSQSGSGALGDIGSHFIYLAYWFFGEFDEVSCQLGFQIKRQNPPHDQTPYEQADDSAMIHMKFKSGALGSIHVSTLANEETPFKQWHQFELHGSDATIHTNCDWDKEQSLKAAKVGEGPVKPMKIPDSIWQGVRQDTVHNTYKDVFRNHDHMTREFINGIMNEEKVEPDFKQGALIQKYLEACQKSHSSRTWVKVD